MNVFQLVRTCVHRQLWIRRTLRGLGRRPGPGPPTIWDINSREQGFAVCTVDPKLEEEFVFADCAGPSDGDRVLRRNLRRGGACREVDPCSRTQFQDLCFPPDENPVSSKSKRKPKGAGPGKGQHKVFGSPDPDEPVSDTRCSGCGAVLQCAAARAPGFLPSQKYKALRQEGGLSGAACQRCHLLTHHHKALQLDVSRDQYRAIVGQIRPLRGLVLLVVDLLDLPDSIVPDLPELVGSNKRVVVLGNKADLIPGDSPGYLARIQQRLARYCEEAGFGPQVAEVRLVSAKTGYGLEALISSLQRSWKYKGDVYLVGGANAGKSTLFNALLRSDFCKSGSGSDRLLRRATASPWPGTTLNLLKFPILNPKPERMFRRRERLKEAELHSQLSHTEPSKGGYLVGRVGRTFCADKRSDEIQFDPDSLAFGENVNGQRRTGSVRPEVEFSYNELKDARWLYDTPGIIKDNDILSLLNEQEVMSLVPTSAIIPRTFVLKPNMSLFVGGVARIDFLHGQRSCWFSVLASGRVPLHVSSLEQADGVYAEHAGHARLGIPGGGSERMEHFPELVPQEFKLKGRGHLEATADITLSSTGWVAVTAVEGDEVTLKVHGPGTTSFGLRTPPLLPHVVALKGKRVGRSAAYKPMKLQELQLTTRGEDRK